MSFSPNFISSLAQINFQNLVKFRLPVDMLMLVNTRDFLHLYITFICIDSYPFEKEGT